MVRWLDKTKTRFYYEAGDGVDIKSGKASFSWGIIGYSYESKGKTIYIIKPNPFDYPDSEGNSSPDPAHLTEEDFYIDSLAEVRL